MPQMSVTVKKMNAFKISFINNLRSIKLAHLLTPSFTRPIEGETNYDTFLDDNSFIHSAIVKCIEDHEALSWIDKETLRNDGIESWNTIVKWYDSESIEESLSASTLNKIIGLKLKDVYMGACSTFITTFVSYLDIFEEK